MNNFIYKPLFLLGLILLLTSALFAQAPTQSLEDRIKQAKAETKKLEDFINDPSTSASLRSSLQPILDSRNAAIKDLEALTKLQVKLSDKELQVVAGQLAANSISSTVPPPAALPASNNTPPISSLETRLCGRLRPTSLDNILTLLSPDLPVFQTSFQSLRTIRNRIETEVNNDTSVDQSNKKSEVDKRVATALKTVAMADTAYPAALLTTIHNGSRFTSDRSSTETVTDCEEEAVILGTQKDAVVKLLIWLLIPTNWDAVASNLHTTATGSSPSLSKEVVRRQILQLNQYLGNVTVQLKVGSNIATTVTDRDGNFLFKKVPIDDSKITPQPATLSTEGDDNYTKRDFSIQKGDQVRLNLLIEDRPVSLLARAVVGYQQAGAAATDTEQNYFFDLFLSKSLPFPQRISPDFGEKWRVWGAIRAISVPNTDNFTIGDAASSFVTKISALKVKDAARIFDYQGGLEFRITGNTAVLPSFDRQTKQKFSLSLIGSFGFVTPTSPLEKEPPVYAITPQLKAALAAQKISIKDPKDSSKDSTYAAFVPDDRDRFFRQYYGGFRMQTFFFNRYNVPMQRFPAQLDLTIGQNEYVTGGRFHGAVFRFDGYFPLPYEKMNFINLFGTAVFKPSRVKITTPLVLKTADGVKPTDDSVLLVPVSQFNRDYYRVGVGIDFLSFVQKLLNRN